MRIETLFRDTKYNLGFGDCESCCHAGTSVVDTYYCSPTVSLRSVLHKAIQESTITTHLTQDRSQIFLLRAIQNLLL